MVWIRCGDGNSDDGDDDDDSDDDDDDEDDKDDNNVERCIKSSSKQWNQREKSMTGHLEVIADGSNIFQNKLDA